MPLSCVSCLGTSLLWITPRRQGNQQQVLKSSKVYKIKHMKMFISEEKSSFVRFQIDWLNFTVKATDSGSPPRSNVVQVFIKVIDQVGAPVM
jgi:hypothetical protein